MPAAQRFGEILPGSNPGRNPLHTVTPASIFAARISATKVQLSPEPAAQALILSELRRTE